MVTRWLVCHLKRLVDHVKVHEVSQNQFFFRLKDIENNAQVDQQLQQINKPKQYQLWVSCQSLWNILLLHFMSFSLTKNSSSVRQTRTTTMSQLCFFTKNNVLKQYKVKMPPSPNRPSRPCEIPPYSLSKLSPLYATLCVSLVDHGDQADQCNHSFFK